MKTVYLRQVSTSSIRIMPTTAESLYKAYRRLSIRERMKFLNHLRNPEQEKSDLPVFSSAGEPLTRAQYVEAINEAIEAVERGELFADADVMRELEAEY